MLKKTVVYNMENDACATLSAKRDIKRYGLPFTVENDDEVSVYVRENGQPLSPGTKIVRIKGLVK